MFQIVWSL